MEETEKVEEGIPGHNVPLPESEEEDANQPLSIAGATSPGASRGSILKNVRFGNSPEKEDNDPERTITSQEDGDDEYLPSNDSEINQISLMDVC